MTDDGFSATFTCAACGSPVLWEEDMRDDETITCANCGTKGPTLGELKAATMELFKDQASKLVGHKIDWKSK